MKNLEDIFEILDGILPADAKKTVMFCEVEKTAYEVFYYSYFADGSCKQCHELAAEGRVDSNALDAGFEKAAKYIRECDAFKPDQRNVVTIVIEGASEKVKIDQFNKTAGLYKIKKDWKAANLY